MSVKVCELFSPYNHFFHNQIRCINMLRQYILLCQLIWLGTISQLLGRFVTARLGLKNRNSYNSF